MFFFSSRRRHTILQGDWSSDVCSSDLRHRTPDASRGTVRHARTARSVWSAAYAAAFHSHDAVSHRHRLRSPKRWKTPHSRRFARYCEACTNGAERLECGVCRRFPFARRGLPPAQTPVAKAVEDTALQTLREVL